MSVRLVFTSGYNSILDMHVVKLYAESVTQLYIDFVNAGKITNFSEEEFTETLTKTTTITFLNQSAWDEYNAQLDILRNQTTSNTLQTNEANIYNMYLEDDSGNRTPI